MCGCCILSSVSSRSIDLIMQFCICFLCIFTIKITITFLTDLEKVIIKFTWKQKRSVADKDILDNKSKAGFIMILYFKLYCKATEIRTAWYWQKKKKTHGAMEQDRRQRKNLRHSKPCHFFKVMKYLC